MNLCELIVMSAAINYFTSGVSRCVDRVHHFIRGSAIDPRIHELLFSRGLGLPGVAASPLSGNAQNAASMVSDCTSLYQSAKGLAGAYGLEISNFTTTQEGIELIDHALGLPSSLNAVIGLVGLKQSRKETAYADAIGDQRGALIGRLSSAKSASACIAGVGAAISSPLAMVSAIKQSSEASLIGRVNHVASKLGTFCYMIFFAVMAAILGVQIGEGSGFLKKLEKQGDLDAQVRWLQSRLDVDPQKLSAKLAEQHGNDLNNLLIEEALDAGKANLAATLKELGFGEVSEARLDSILNSLIDRSDRTVKKELVRTGLAMRVQKARVKRSAKMQRILGAPGTAALNEIKGLRGSVSRDYKNELVCRVRASAEGKIRENGILLAVSLLGLPLMVAGLVVTGGVALTLLAVSSLLFSILTTAVDGYYLYQSYQSEQPAYHDKTLVALSTAVAIGAAISLIVLTATGVVTFGIFPLIVFSIGLLLWLGQNGACLAVMHHKEKRFQLEHPSLETFLEALKREDEQNRIMEMFGNLPDPVRAAIQKELGSHANDMHAAARSVLQRTLDAKDKQLEQLRNWLTPYLVNEVEG